MKKLKIAIQDVQQIKMYSEDSTYVGSYDRIGNSREFQLSFEDSKEHVCSICGRESEKDHEECIQQGYYTIDEEELIEDTLNTFEDIIDDEDRKIRNIIEINGCKFIKRFNN